MNLATSHSNRHHEPPKRLGAALICFAVYTLLVFGLAALFYKLLLNKMWLVPVLAEVAFIKNASTTGPFWKGWLARAAGITLGNVLAYFIYIIPVIYEGKQPWSEEALWAYIIVAVQIGIATVVLVATRRVLRKKEAPVS